MEKLANNLFQDPQIDAEKSRIAGIPCISYPTGSRCLTTSSGDVIHDTIP